MDYIYLLNFLNSPLGMEYRAVFLCTSEPVNEDFTPYDSVKSLCDPRVFNTIITRSQSLVVAVGNPFRLVEIESKSQADGKQCWLSYFQECLQHDSFVMAEELQHKIPYSVSESMQINYRLLHATEGGT